MTPDDERTVLQSIMQGFEVHYKNAPEMFASKYNFDKFLDTKVRFHAKLLEVDSEMSKAALISWIEQNHTMKYIWLA